MPHKRRKSNAGRKTVLTPDTLQKLEDAFMNAFTDKMACLYAGISETALYDYCVKKPRFAERKELLKTTPDLAAQKKLVQDVNDTSGARWWAEHKMPDFMPKTKVEHGGKIQVEDLTPISPDIAEATKQYLATRRKQIEAETREMLKGKR